MLVEGCSFRALLLAVYSIDLLVGDHLGYLVDVLFFLFAIVFILSVF